MSAHVLTALVSTLGGLGLFLLGMLVMTEGLRGLASGALRRSLTRFTRSPLSGAVTGAASTALVQSSSAVTVAAVGFVGAGLLTFSHALGVIIGANIGTTVTGWLVALLGFKLQIGNLALPLVLAGALLRLLGGERTANAGYGLAGFGLVFVGISALQQWEDFETRKRPYREAVLRRAAAGHLDATAALECLDVMRHLRRTAYHLWRIVHHLRRARMGSALEERDAVPPHAEAAPAD